jgi:hypothetical protein
MLKLDDGRKALYQWDVGVTATVFDDQITQVHFSNLTYGVPFSVDVAGGKVLIPPEVLQSGADVYCWAYVSTDDTSYTKKDVVFNVIKRPKPSGYIYTPTDVETLESVKEELLKEISNLENGAIKVAPSKNIWELEAGAYFVNGNVLYATPDPPVSPNTIFLNGEKCLLIVTVDPLENNKRYFYLFAKGKVYFGYSKSNGVFGDVELTEGAINGEFAKVTNTITAKNPDEIPSTEAVVNYVDTTIGGIENGSY